jgi:hypothetical protein
MANEKQQLSLPLDPATVQILQSIIQQYLAASGVAQIIAGTNITISPSAGTGAVTINSTAAPGVTSLAAGTGISVSASTGAVTVSINLTPGTGIGISGATISNGGVTSIIAGPGISVSGPTGAVTVSASGGSGSSATYANGTTNYLVGTTSSPITIPHGLSGAPKVVRIFLDWVVNGGWCHTQGEFDSSGQNCVGVIFTTSTSQPIVNNSYIAEMINNTNTGYRFLCSVDSTNIYLTVSGLGSGTPIANGSQANILWEAEY